MLPVSENFTEAELADVNQVAAKILLVLGNYAASQNGGSVTASGSDGSGDYPASGSIDGDRTELNVGPASTADNGIGLSSWRSAVAPSSTPQTLTIDMGAIKAINRIKLYHLSDHGLSSYKLESSDDDVSYSLIAKTTDQGGTIDTTSELDVIDFTEIECRYVRLTIDDTVVPADKANVVELEIYRLVDISQYVVSVRVNRQRDYKLGNPLATTLQIVCNNSDQFFSFDYTPLPSQVDDGYINSQIQPNIGIIAQYGFAFGGGAPELVTQFVGYVDLIRLSPRDKTARIDARDGMKTLINQVLSSKLQTSIDIGECIQYALNLCNVSNWEMELDTTGIVIDYFFIANQQILGAIRDLVTGAGDAIFYFSEDGIAIFKSFLGLTPQADTITSQADWENGTLLQNIDTTSVPNRIGRKWFLIDDFTDGNFSSNPVWNNRVETAMQTDDSQADFDAGTVLTNIDTTLTPGDIQRKWFLIDDFADGDYTSNPAWTVRNGNYPSFPPAPPNKWSVSAGKLFFLPESTGYQGRAYIPFTGQVTGSWEFSLQFAFNDTATGGYAEIFIIANDVWNTTGPRGQLLNGYCIRFDKTENNIIIERDDSGVRTELDRVVYPIDTSQHLVRITRNSTGTINVYVDGVLLATGGNTDYSTTVYFGVMAQLTGASGSDNVNFDNFRYSPVVLLPADAYTGSQAVFESRVFDLTADIATLQQFNATYNAPVGSSVSFFVATSADGISFDPFIAITPGNLMTNTPRRYLKYRVLFVCPVDSGTANANFITPSVSNVQITYTTVGWKIISSEAAYLPLTSGVTAGLDLGFILATGTWRAQVTMTPGSGAGMAFRLYFLTAGYDIPTGTYLSGYYAQVDQANGKIGLYEINGAGSRSLIAEAVIAIDTSAHSLRVTRTAAGEMKIFWDEVEVVSDSDSTFTVTAALALEVDPLADTNGSAEITNIHYSPAIDGVGAISTSQAIYESEVIDMGASISELGIFQAGVVAPSGTSLQFYTATSPDGVTFDAYVPAFVGSAIDSAVQRYLKFKIIFTTPNDSGIKGDPKTPVVTDVTINWYTGTGSEKYPSSVSYVFTEEDMLLDMDQEYSDVLGGDTSILNNIAVQASPLYLAGADTDTQWQGTVQTPPVPISAGDPLAVSNGQVLTYEISIPNGMDVSNMAGANPAAAAIVAAGGASAAWEFTRIHPTQPILQITITGNGTLTDLRVIGKAFTNSNAIALQTAADQASIVRNGDRPLQISNRYILTEGVAALIAARLLENYKDPISFVPFVRVRPVFSCQLNDRITVRDSNTGVDADYVICGVAHVIQATVEAADAVTELTLLKVV